MRWYPSSSPFGDPGPCPVDDAPHTTCTSADAGAEPRRIVIQQLPMYDEQLAATRPRISVAPVVPLQPGEVTQATYRRAGRKGR